MVQARAAFYEEHLNSVLGLENLQGLCEVQVTRGGLRSLQHARGVREPVVEVFGGAVSGDHQHLLSFTCDEVVLERHVSRGRGYYRQRPDWVVEAQGESLCSQGAGS